MPQRTDAKTGSAEVFTTIVVQSAGQIPTDSPGFERGPKFSEHGLKFGFGVFQIFSQPRFEPVPLLIENRLKCDFVRIENSTDF